MKKSPVLDNEFKSQVRIAQRRMDDGDFKIEHEAMVYAGEAIKGQQRALNWLLRRVIVTPEGEVLLTNSNRTPSLKSLSNVYSITSDEIPA